MPKNIDGLQMQNETNTKFNKDTSPEILDDQIKKKKGGSEVQVSRTGPNALWLPIIKSGLNGFLFFRFGP